MKEEKVIKHEPKKEQKMPIKVMGGVPVATSRFELEKEIERELGMHVDVQMKDESIKAHPHKSDTPNMKSEAPSGL